MSYTSRALIPIINELNNTYRTQLKESDVIFSKSIDVHNLHDYIEFEVEITLNNVKTTKTFKSPRLDLREVLNRHQLPDHSLTQNELLALLQTEQYPIYPQDVVLNYNPQENRLHVIAQTDSLYYYGHTVLDVGKAEVYEYEGKTIHGLMLGLNEAKPLDFKDIAWSRLDGTIELARSSSVIPGYNHILHPRLNIVKHTKVRNDKYWLHGEFLPLPNSGDMFTTLIYDPYEGVVHDMFDTIDPDDIILPREDDIYWVIKRNTCLAINELGITTQTYPIPYNTYGAVKTKNNYFVLLIKDDIGYCLRTWHPVTGSILNLDVRLNVTFTTEPPLTFVRDPITNNYLIQFPVDGQGDWILNQIPIMTQGIKTGWISITPTGLHDASIPLVTNIPYYTPYAKTSPKPKHWVINNEIITTYLHQDDAVTRVNTMTVKGVPLFESSVNHSALIPTQEHYEVIQDVWYDQGYCLTALSNGNSIIRQTNPCDSTQILTNQPYYFMRINSKLLPPKITVPLLEQGGKVLLYGWGTSHTPLLIN